MKKGNTFQCRQWTASQRGNQVLEEHIRKVYLLEKVNLGIKVVYNHIMNYQNNHHLEYK